jgi:hypothetical protein
MKSIFDVGFKPRRVKPKATKLTKRNNPYIRKPTPPDSVQGDVTMFDICRILPSFVADNFEVFETLPFNKLKVKRENWSAYVDRIKKKILCFNANY